MEPTSAFFLSVKRKSDAVYVVTTRLFADSQVRRILPTYVVSLALSIVFESILLLVSDAPAIFAFPRMVIVLEHFRRSPIALPVFSTWIVVGLQMSMCFEFSIGVIVSFSLTKHDVPIAPFAGLTFMCTLER